MHFKCLTVLILKIIASQNSSFISLIRYLLLETKTQYKGPTIYYSFIQETVQTPNFESTRNTPPPPPPSSVCDTIIANNTVQKRLVRFWMAFPRLRYLCTNCTLTFGSSHCWLLIFSRMKSVRFQLSTKRKETDTPVRVESEGNPRYFTVLWRLCLFSHVIIFR